MWTSLFLGCIWMCEDPQRNFCSTFVCTEYIIVLYSCCIILHCFLFPTNWVLKVTKYQETSPVCLISWWQSFLKIVSLVWNFLAIQQLLNACNWFAAFEIDVPLWHKWSPIVAAVILQMQWPWRSRLMHKVLIPNDLVPNVQNLVSNAWCSMLAQHSLHNSHTTYAYWNGQLDYWTHSKLIHSITLLKLLPSLFQHLSFSFYFLVYLASSLHAHILPLLHHTHTNKHIHTAHTHAHTTHTHTHTQHTCIPTHTHTTWASAWGSVGKISAVTWPPHAPIAISIWP